MAKLCLGQKEENWKHTFLLKQLIKADHILKREVQQYAF